MTDPLIEQIEGLGNRHLLGCIGKFVLAVIIAGLVIGIVAKHTQDKPIRGAVALMSTGLVLGFATSVLTTWSRRFLKILFVALPLAASVVLFGLRTLVGWHHELPLRLVLSPLCFSIGFLVGQARSRLHIG